MAKTVVEPFAKKAAGKSGNFIMKKLASQFTKSKPQSVTTRPNKAKNSVT